MGKIPLFSISHLQIVSYFWYQATIEAKPLTFLYFNWMVKECVKPKKFKFQTFIFFNVNPSIMMSACKLSLCDSSSDPFNNRIRRILGVRSLLNGVVDVEYKLRGPCM